MAMNEVPATESRTITRLLSIGEQLRTLEKAFRETLNPVLDTKDRNDAIAKAVVGGDCSSAVWEQLTQIEQRICGLFALRDEIIL